MDLINWQFLLMLLGIASLIGSFIAQRSQDRDTRRSFERMLFQMGQVRVSLEFEFERNPTLLWGDIFALLTPREQRSVSITICHTDTTNSTGRFTLSPKAQRSGTWEDIHLDSSRPSKPFIIPSCSLRSMLNTPRKPRE